MSRPSMSGRSSEVERIIAAAEVDTTFAGKKTVRYRGRRATWPGALGLLLIFVGSVVGLVFYGIKVHQKVNDRIPSDSLIRERFGLGTPINDGRPVSNATEDVDVVNPEKYKDKKCEQPNYLSKNGRIFAAFGSGKEVQLDIKGVNWLGMDVLKGVPKGLWDNQREGTTLYRVGQFLSNNKFNAVRLPLSIDSAMRNIEVDTNLINTNTNRALSATRYNKMIGQIAQGLGQFGIGVVLDFQVLSAISKDDTQLWFGTSIQLDDIKTAITNLGKELCNGKHFNIIGLDLKDGIGKSATWGDGTDTDWSVAATALGEHLVKTCPKWLAFIQGVQGSAHKETFEGDRVVKTKFFAGSDLTGVAKNPIKLSTEGKVVYSPKYMSSSYLPQQFFFDSGTSNGDMLSKYKESDDETLKKNVYKSMDMMFGAALETGAAVVLSQFGGLTGSEDRTPKKTSTRIMKFVIEKMLASEKPLGGGFWWTFNGDTYWPYPAPDNSTAVNSGLVDEIWRNANLNNLGTLEGMDKMSSIEFIPCNP